MSSGGTRSEPGPGGGDPRGSLVALLDADPVVLSDGEVTEALVGLCELSGRLAAATARLAASFETRSLPAVDGARTAASWLAARTELSRPAAGGLVRTGRGLRACAVVDAAARQGRLGAAKVRLLLDARVGVEALFGECEEALVDDVAELTVEAAARVIARWRQAALAAAGADDGPEPHADAGRNHVQVSKGFGGRWNLAGEFDAFTGEALANSLEAWIDARFAAGAVDADDPRPRSGHRADALAALVCAGDSVAAGASGPRARVVITWDADDLLGKPVADLADLARRRRATDAGSTLAYEVAATALCDAEVVNLLVRFGFEDRETVLGVTHDRRHPTERERDALAERDRGCVFPGCDAPVVWCHAHHIVPFEIGHRTRLDELVLLCGHHHRLVHTPGWTLARSETTGQVYVTRPDGTTLAGADQPPPGHKLPIRGPDPGPPPLPFDPAARADRDATERARLDDDLTRRWHPPDTKAS